MVKKGRKTRNRKAVTELDDSPANKRIESDSPDESEMIRSPILRRAPTRGRPGVSTGITSCDNVHSPFFLHSADHPGLCIVTHKLDGTNYNKWFIAMKMSLDAKNKLSFVDGSLPRPDLDDDLFRIWSRCNSMVKSWILNVVNQEIYDSILYYEDAAEMWTDLFLRFRVSNLLRKYQLEQSIASLKQGSLDLSTYYTKMKTLWEELANTKNSTVNKCSCDFAKELLDEAETSRIIQFLMGLNDSFANIRGQILNMRPRPGLTEIYNMLDQDESLKRQASTDLSQNTVASADIKLENTSSSAFDVSEASVKPPESNKAFRNSASEAEPNINGSIFSVRADAVSPPPDNGFLGSSPSFPPSLSKIPSDKSVSELLSTVQSVAATPTAFSEFGKFPVNTSNDNNSGSNSQSTSAPPFSSTSLFKFGEPAAKFASTVSASTGQISKETEVKNSPLGIINGSMTSADTRTGNDSTAKSSETQSKPGLEFGSSAPAVPDAGNNVSGGKSSVGGSTLNPFTAASSAPGNSGSSFCGVTSSLTLGTETTKFSGPTTASNTFGTFPPAFTSSGGVAASTASMPHSHGPPTTPPPSVVQQPFFFGQPSFSMPQPVVGGPPVTPPSSVANPFPCGVQQFASTTQNPSPFQPSQSLEFQGGGGSFSLGSTGGGNMSSRRIFKARKSSARKK